MDKKDLSDIAKSHWTYGPVAEVSVLVGGVAVLLRGKSTEVLDVSIPVVVLLTKESTPREFSVDDSALTEFKKAAQKLVETGQPFCTLLRPNWCLPAFLWQKA